MPSKLNVPDRILPRPSSRSARECELLDIISKFRGRPRILSGIALGKTPCLNQRRFGVAYRLRHPIGCAEITFGLHFPRPTSWPLSHDLSVDRGLASNRGHSRLRRQCLHLPRPASWPLSNGPQRRSATCPCGFRSFQEQLPASAVDRGVAERRPGHLRSSSQSQQRWLSFRRGVSSGRNFRGRPLDSLATILRSLGTLLSAEIWVFSEAIAGAFRGRPRGRRTTTASSAFVEPVAAAPAFISGKASSGRTFRGRPLGRRTATAADGIATTGGASSAGTSTAAFNS